MKWRTEIMAGRKDKNTVDYFPHYVNSGKTMFILESKFKHVGYSVWFKTLEILGKNENHYIDLRDDTDLLYLVSKLQITEEKLNDIYNLLAKLGAIDIDLWNEKIVFSENFIKNIEDAYTRRKNKCMQKLDLCTHLNINCEHKLNKLQHKTTKESKGKEIKQKKKHFDFLKTFGDKFSFYKNEFKEIFETEFLEVKNKKKASVTERALLSQLKKIDKFSQGNHEIAFDILEKSINSGWTDFYELKKNKTKQPENQISKKTEEIDYSKIEGW